MTTDNIQVLLDILERERAATDRLRDAARIERERMIARDYLALEQSIAEKQTLIAELQQLEGERRSLLERAGYAPTPLGIQQWADTYDEDGATTVLNALSRLIDSARDCQAENLRCGRLNALSQRWVREMLALYRSDGTTSNLYQNDGSVAAASASKSLASA